VRAAGQAELVCRFSFATIPLPSPQGENMAENNFVLILVKREKVGRRLSLYWPSQPGKEIPTGLVARTDDELDSLIRQQKHQLERAGNRIEVRFV
jgi:hypothetical protein